MKVVDKRLTPQVKEFGLLPIGTVFEHPEDGGVFMKIGAACEEDNAIDLIGCSLFHVYPNNTVIELNAHLEVEG